jgi:hypothetical protein
MVGLSQWAARSEREKPEESNRSRRGHVYLHYVLSLPELVPDAQSHVERKPAIIAAMHRR